MSPDGPDGSANVVGGLFQDLFSTPEMRSIFCDRALVQSWLDAEVALAKAEAACGVIPDWAADQIERCGDADRFDVDDLRRGIAKTDHPLVTLVWQFAETCGEAGKYVHWGATTQDIMDTGMVLQLRAAMAVTERRTVELGDLLAELAERERDTIMAGRTHGQQALPITFGLKVAVWLWEASRNLCRLREARPRVLMGQLAGAAGTFAPLAGDAERVRVAFCELLDLAVPTAPWHVARDGLAELTNVLAMSSATCARVAHEVILLQKTEVAEVEERHDEGNVGSTTMPQKRNPMTAESVMAASRLTRRNAATALEGMIGEHERDMSSWQAEWSFVPEVCQTADAALGQTIDVIRGLTVDRERMAANLRQTGGLLMAEAVMIALGRHVGRQRAHDLVHHAAMRAIKDGGQFLDQLVASPAIVEHLGDGEAIRGFLDPAAYLGDAQQSVDRVVNEFQQQRRIRT